MDATETNPTGTSPASAYRVLARKYRPQGFEDLIGQDAMVRTLRNAFAANRIHQAYIFTGVRGVGKTTTARILARALNYETASIHAPQIDMPDLGLHCEAIMESRHVDVIEMDAASNTSIANVREIIEAARYKPVSARTKVYIIDEVHMLSNAAFNGLLKTLEEPPPHVKFLFATTEIRKVPITVLSRCQRFDLRRIEVPEMVAYLDRIVAKEGVRVEPEAMALIARASEGSMRDALSLLDQAIAHGNGQVAAHEVRASLGLADRARIIDLFEALMSGEIANALAEFSNQYDSGADPAAILTDLAEFVHLVTRLKLMPEAARDPALSESERQRGTDAAKRLAIRSLSMAWQILLKGHAEVQAAARPRIAAEMVLVRLAYAAELPSPADTIRDIRNGTLPSGGGGTVAPGGGGASASAPPPPRLAVTQGGGQTAQARRLEPESDHTADMPASIEALVALAESHRDIRLMTALQRNIRLLSLEPGRIDLMLDGAADADTPNRLAKALRDWTGKTWVVSLGRPPAGAAPPPTLHEHLAAEKAEEERGVRGHPAIRALLDAFPGAEITAIREPAMTSTDETEPGEGALDAPFTDDDL